MTVRLTVPHLNDIIDSKSGGSLGTRIGGSDQIAYWEIEDASGDVVPISGTGCTTYPAYPNNWSPTDKLWTSITINPVSNSQFPNLDNSGYTSDNWYFNNGYGGQCVAFVYGRTIQKGINLSAMLESYNDNQTPWGFGAGQAGSPMLQIWGSNAI